LRCSKSRRGQETFADKRGGERQELERRAAEVDKDVKVIREALGGLSQSSDSFIKQLAPLQASTTDDLAATLRHIRILLAP
jgi:hypothetical protein